MRFERLNNTRDLGGIPADGGKTIKRGRLYRSGKLSRATAADLKVIEKLGLTKIIDFRSEKECGENPDPEVAGAVSITLPAVKDMTKGITRDSLSDKRAVEALLYEGMAQEGFAERYMCGMYENFVADEFCRKQYARFLRELTDADDNTVLWHCSTGKDRAGTAAVMVLHLLGVDRDTILADYLKTNGNIKEHIDHLVEIYVPDDAPPRAEKAVRTLYSANEAFLNAMFAKAEELYGSYGRFLTEGLGADEAYRERLKELYLE